MRLFRRQKYRRAGHVAPSARLPFGLKSAALPGLEPLPLTATIDPTSHTEQKATAPALALLFISKAFFQSDFIASVELRRLLARRLLENIRAVPMILDYCAWQTNKRIAAHYVRPALEDDNAPVPLLVCMNRWIDKDQPLLDFLAG